MDKFDIIRTKATNGASYKVTTNDIQTKFEQWDNEFGIDISEVAYNQVMVRFHFLPADLTELANEIYLFCPDVINKQFAYMGIVVEIMNSNDQKLNPTIENLIDGVDLHAKGFGEILLQRSIRSTKGVVLWWD